MESSINVSGIITFTLWWIALGILGGALAIIGRSKNRGFLYVRDLFDILGRIYFGPVLLAGVIYVWVEQYAVIITTRIKKSGILDKKITFKCKNQE